MFQFAVSELQKHFRPLYKRNFNDQHRFRFQKKEIKLSKGGLAGSL